jgi:type II secretory pathway pseudopilin PulG
MTSATVRVARTARPSTRPAARATARAGYLRLVATRRSSAARAPFVMVVVVILAVGLLGLLLLNTVLAQDAFRLHALQVQSRTLADQEQSLQREVERLQSPQSLATRATALNMVPGGTRAFLRLSDGKVLGVALPGEAPPPPPPPPAATKLATTTSKPATAGTGGWVAVPPAGQQPAHKPAAKPGPRR